MFRHCAALVVVGVMAVATGGCSASSSARLTIPSGGGPVAGMVGKRGPGQPQSDGDELVCLDRPGSVHVEAVRPVKPTGGLHVQAFVLQKSPWMSGPDRSSIGDAYHSLKQAGVLNDNVKTLTMVCDAKTGAGYIVDIQMAYTHGQVGHADGFEVDYVSGGVHKKMFLPLAFTLCAGGMHDRACGRVDSQLHPVSQLATEAAAQR